MNNSTEMKDKTCLITGATSGIGFTTALGLAEKQAKLILVSRNPDKLKNTASIITKKTGNSRIDTFTCDLSSMGSIRSFADEFKKKYKRLDILLNNAGAFYSKRITSVDGYELTFALDHLGYFLLTRLLTDLLKVSKTARIINVSSGAQANGHIDFDDIMKEKKYSGFSAYCQAKLANVVFTVELSKRLFGTGITANCLHPGLVRTNFMENSTGAFKVIGNILVKIAAISPEEGAKTSIYLASSPEVSGVTGKYFSKCLSVPYNKEADNPEIAKKLWELSEKLTGFRN